MNRGKVLLICYYFPPLGLAGVTRPLNLFKYLPLHGYDCHVLTVKPVAYRTYEPELLEGLDESRIHRAGSRDPQRLMYLLGIREVNPKTIERGASVSESLFPDSKIGWVAPAVRLGKRLHKQHSYRAVISTSPPISSHLVGMKLAGQTGVPWIADFRDFWTLRPIEESYQSAERVAQAKKLLNEIQRQAKSMVAVNPSMASYLGASHVIGNGADPALARLWTQPSEEDKFTIGILGTLNDSSPIEPLLRVLAVLKAESPELFERVRLVQVGTVDQSWLSRHLESYQMSDRCTSYGLKPRRESIALLLNSNLMYLGLAPSLERITTARVYDMLVSGRPILAHVSPDSDLARLVTETGNGLAFDDQNMANAVRYIAGLVTSHIRHASCVTLMPEYARPYLWDNLAGQYAELLDEVAQ